MVNKLYCFSREEFNEFCKDWNSTDYPENSAFISICNTKFGDFLFIDEITHHFKEETNEIINLDFEDITEPSITYQGKTMYAISEDDAKRLVEFIDSNIGKDFYVHCEAGLSRSQGVVRYILDIYGEDNFETRKNNPCRTPNLYVTAMLKREYYKLKGLEFT